MIRRLLPLLLLPLVLGGQAMPRVCALAHEETVQDAGSHSSHHDAPAAPHEDEGTPPCADVMPCHSAALPGEPSPVRAFADDTQLIMPHAARRAVESAPQHSTPPPRQLS